MKRLLLFLVTVVVSFLGVAMTPAGEPVRQTQSFDNAWKFNSGDAPGAAQPQFDDRAWRKLDVPHDWSIEGPFSETNRTGGAGGFLPSGVGWYRKEFTLPDTISNRCVFIEFDGVMQNSEVWINGVSLGKRPFGYVSFGYELTGHLIFGAGRTNVLAVRADTSEQPASRWYSGAGIYRHVRLVVTDPVHFGQGGNFVTTTPVATLTMRPGKKTPMAMVQVQSTVTNQSEAARDLVVQLTVLNPDGKSVAENQTALQTVAPGQSVVFKLDVLVRNPQLWNLDNPKLYRAVCQIRDGKKVLDEQFTSFGIREFHFDADTGFWLNGKNFKIKGVCLHHDGGAFGAAVPLGVWEERKEFQDQGCLPASRWRCVWRGGAAGGLGRTVENLEIARSECHPHGPQPAGAGVSRFVRPPGIPGHGRNVRLLDRGEKSLRLSPLFQRMVENGRARYHPTRPESSRHHSLQRGQ